MRAPASLAAALLLAASCSGDDGAPAPAGPATVPASSLAFAGGDVAEGEPIDAAFTCDGRNVSPALRWRGVPEEAVELALVVDDPDAPGGSFVHWVAYAIPPSTAGLDAGVPPGPVLSGGLTLRQGLNDGSGVPGYTGPCPPGGVTHRYVFTLYALDEESGLEGGASRDELLAAVEGHVVGEAALTATYARP
jgi:Raf kinase inhibitor-like YbhB/YbcL family protein